MPKETLLKRPLDEWGTSAAQFYARIERKPVVIHLRGGQTLSGELAGLDTFDVVLEREDGKQALIPKHAIDWIEQASGA